MMLQLMAGFTLIEDGKVWQDVELDISDSVVSDFIYQPYVGQPLTASEAAAGQVKQMILSLLKGQKYKVPVIFDRTGQLDHSAPKGLGFSVGLLTSGTTGQPKLVFHNVAKVLPKNIVAGKQSCWLLCYHPMSFAGLQVLLQTMLSGDTLIVSNSNDISEKAKLAIRHKVNCLSLTPSVFRALASCWVGQKPPLTQITFGGEICQQDTLDLARAMFPDATIRHIYALTEAGVIFSVKDLQAGFPAAWMDQRLQGWSLHIEQEELILTHDNMRICTGDRVRLDQDRVFFLGRTDNVVNIGGAKVDLVSIELALADLPGLVDLRVYAKKNPITGFIVGVQLLSNDEIATRAALHERIATWPKYQRPALIGFVDQIPLSENGKKLRLEC